MKMKAAVYYKPLDIRVENIEVPDIGPNDILIKVKYCGICGSDVHSYKLGLYIKPGQIMGHEYCGEIVKVGENVKNLEVGERVFASEAELCGECYWCKRQMYAMCPRLFEACTGYGKPGAYAEYIKIGNASLDVNVFKIPDELDDITAATIEPTSVAANAVLITEPQKDDKVVILGAGFIGNVILQIFKSVPVGKIVVSEVSPLRLDAAKKKGADAIINANTESVLERCKEEVGIGPYHFNVGAMADVVVEAAGVPSTIRDSLEIVRSGGTISIVALAEKETPINTTKIVHKAPKILGAFGGSAPVAINYLKEKKATTQDLITHVFSLDNIQEAFEVQSDAYKSIKVMVKP
ncbi:zinc-dependent alcohol dehydrogenase [Tepidanaerobacter syntrophicus]|uniref:zinc-dependent alcohol dehydrogenase n=1 Tax=Tepidanaerobacter syntrophicus TaxID=224999 RepID=UPI001BD33C5E|nr:alcohol dehydrogenase catalytic domain-containing protein [Tepidanaerobacter syntrophicus]